MTCPTMDMDSQREMKPNVGFEESGLYVSLLSLVERRVVLQLSTLPSP